MVWTSLLPFYSFESSSHQHELMVFYWSLSDSKSRQVSRTLLSILADLNNAVIWMSPLMLLCPSTNPLVTVPREPITIGITVTFMFHSFFSSRARSWYLSHFHSPSVLPCGQPGWQSPQFSRFFFFCCWLSLGLVILLRLHDLFVSQKSQRILCLSFSRTDSKLCIYHLFAWSNLSFLHSSQ